MCGINPYRVQSNCFVISPRLSLRSNLGLELANAFGVIVSPLVGVIVSPLVGVIRFAFSRRNSFRF
jgi:hypothetical protein